MFVRNVPTRVSRLRAMLALLVCLLAVPSIALGGHGSDLRDSVLPWQDPAATTTAPPPANLAHVEGVVDLIHEGLSERATAGVILLDGDIVRSANGRAEIVFGDGTLLHLDHNTQIELLSPTRLRLIDGRVSLRVSASAGRYVVDTAAAAVLLDPRGEYGITADGRLAKLDVTVTRGAAEINDGSTPVLVRAGELAWIAGHGGRARLERFNSARWDAFAQWSNDRATGFATAVSSSRLPYELRPYGQVLDQYGHWNYVAPHGYVWFPAVSASWRPYYTGSWAHTRYGWTWLGHDPWAWPTHHYGRWGFTGAVWYWIPAKVWGPAWVSWGFAPGFVSWCPLGFDGRPVVGFWPRRDHPAYWPNYDPWNAWTIIPRDHFGGRRAVRTHAIDGNRLNESTRQAIVVQSTPPPTPVGQAVPRGTLSSPAARSATGAVPRDVSTAPRSGDVRRPEVPRFQRAEVPRSEATNAGTQEPRNPETLPPGAVRRGAPTAAYVPAYGTQHAPTREEHGAVPDPRATAPEYAPRYGNGAVNRRTPSAPVTQSEPVNAAPPPEYVPAPSERQRVEGRPRQPSYSPPPRERQAPPPQPSAPSDGGPTPRGSGRVRDNNAGASAPPPRSEGASGGARRRPPS